MLHEFKAQVEASASEGSMTARLFPIGEPVPYGSGTVEFARGLVNVPTTVPLTVDHSTGIFSTVGVLERYSETDTAAFAEFTIADTEDGRTLRELLKLGAVTDVSVGIEHTGPVGEKLVMEGNLDHVSIVNSGRFSRGVDAPAKVLSVHSNEEEPNMAEITDEATAPVVEFDDSEIRESLVELAHRIDEIPTPEQAPAHSPLEVFAAVVGQRFGVHTHALADVIGDLGTADASGIVPDTYWAGGLQHLTDRRRPLYATAGAAPFPASGNNLELPRITQSTAVAARTGEKAEPATQALQAEVNSFPIVWFAGAVDVSLEIISQSDPSVLQVIATDMLTQYAKATEADATTKIAAVATHTGAALTTDTYANFVADVITTSDLIEDAIGSPGNILGVTPAQWIAILSLMDGGDRRQFSMMNPQNADGTSTLVTRGIDVGGVFVYRAPDATTALQYNSESFKNGEKSPMQVAVDNVALMGRDVGVLGATVNAFWPAGIYSYEVV